MNQQRTVLDVAGMSCGSCVRHVTAALTAVPGVSKVDVLLAEGVVHVQHAGASLSGLVEALRREGYEAQLVAP